MKAASRPPLVASLALGGLLLSSNGAAGADAVPDTPEAPAARASAPYRPSFEANLFQPFLGITDAKVLLPIVRRAVSTFRGELMLGAYTDYAWGPISRPADDYGKVWILGARPGYREYLVAGFFVDVSMVVGVRHEERNVRDGTTLNGVYGRVWANAGWQVDVTPRVFLNVRAGAGRIAFRTDRFGGAEKTWQPAADLDVGLRF